MSDSGNHRIQLFVYGPTGIPNVRPPTLLHLSAYPNPFSPLTTFEWSLGAKGPVSLRIYDIGGRSVRTLIDREMTAGPFAEQWDGRDDTGRPVPSGVYFVRLESGGAVATRKISLVR